MEHWAEGPERGATAICLCVLTQWPPQPLRAQIRSSHTPANCKPPVFVREAAEKLQDHRGPFGKSFMEKHSCLISGNHEERPWR